MNAEQDGDRHPQPGGRRPDHVGEGVVGVLQEALIREKDHLMVEMGQRENLPVMMMGKITDTGRMVVKGSKTAVVVAVELVLSEMPNTFVDHHVPMVLLALDLPKDLTVLRPAAPTAERHGDVLAESLLHDGLCDGNQRAAGE